MSDHYDKTVAYAMAFDHTSHKDCTHECRLVESLVSAHLKTLQQAEEIRILRTGMNKIWAQCMPNRKGHFQRGTPEACLNIAADTCGAADSLHLLLVPAKSPASV